MIRNDLRSQTLDLLRFPLAVVVLIIHTISENDLMLQGNTITFEGMPVFQTINRLINGFLRGQSVPIYFFIAGYVFFLNVDLTKETYFRKLKNRMKTLLIPYIIWNVLALMFSLICLLPCFSSVFPRAHNMMLDFSLPALLETFWNANNGVMVNPLSQSSYVIYPQDGPLWFVRDLMIVVVCTPLLYQLLKRTRYYAVLLTGVAWFVLDWDLGYMKQLLTAFFFFSWGASMSIGGRDMLVEFGRFFKASMWLYPVLALLCVTSEYYCPWATEWLKRLNVFVGLLFAYNVAAWLLKRKLCKVSPFLASSAFFIYVAHALICEKPLKGFLVVFRPTSDAGMIAVHALAVMVTLGLLLLVYRLMKRYTPRLLKVISGGR